MAVIASAPAMAQSWKWDLGVNAGYATYTSAIDEDETGLPDNTAASEVHWKPGILYGVQLGYWFGPKLGLRLNGRYSDRPLEGSDIDEDVFVTATNLWGATADLMFRFREPSEQFSSFEMLPYLALGLGAKWHNGNEDQFTCVDGTNSFNCSPFVTGIPGNPRGFAFGEENAIAGLIGLGADWRLGRNFALRTEISDQIYKPQFHTATIPPAGSTTWTVSEENIASVVHEIAGQVGLHFLFGVERPPVVAVVPPPAPPPPPAEPEVRRESITVCVIDPTSPGGIRLQTATLIEGRDTVIVVNGTERPLREAVGNVMVAQNATWFVQGQPLVMNIGTNRVEFTTYGTPRMIEGEDLAFLGTVNGFPVYADRDEVEEVIEDLNELNRARAGTDFGQILEENRELADELDDVTVLYVPMHATGCVFQAVQRQEEVRKGGK
ncbi:MAG: outer membrane beta-barrel protein [Gemmatimonadota bacterium]